MSVQVPGRVIAGLLLLVAWWVTVAPLGAAPAAKVRIIGYINESSGCQDATIKHLRAFAAKHPTQVALEIVDFGSDEGRTRWHADGHNCETLVVNGSSQFRVGSARSARIAVFKMPEGVRWTFDDLDTVLAQELRAPGSSALSDAAAEKLARQVPVASRPARWQGRSVGEVIVGAQTVFRFTGKFGGKTPAQRAEASARLLKRLYAGGLSSEDIRVVQGEVGGSVVGGIFARGQEIAVVTPSEANIIRRPSVQAARFWAFNLSEALRLLGR